MTKRRENKFKSHIYFKALAVWIVYLLISNSIAFWAFHTQEILLAYIIPFVYGAAVGIIFLYLFTHEDFFKFAHEIEKKRSQIRKEAV